MRPRILAALAAAFLGLVPVGALGQTISGGGGSVPLTASCLTQSVAQLCFDATNVLALRNGTNAQQFNIYNTFTDASNNELGRVWWSSNVFTIDTIANGTGTSRGVQIGTRGSAIINFFTNNQDRWKIDVNGNFVPQVNAGYFATNVHTVSGLATCNTAAKGARDFVTDATATTFLSAVAGAGANNVPVVCDGTSWKIG